MKALSLRQPWAGLIGAGLKTIETRKWRTNFRGDLLIVSAQKADQMMSGHYKDPLCYKKSCTIAIVEVVGCVLMTEKHEEAAMCRAWPDLTLYAWILENIRPTKNIPVKGQLSIFDIPYLTYENLLE